MDESFMSTGSFDEETFLTETLQNTSSEFSIPETSNNANKRIDVSELMTKPLEKPIEFQTKSKLDFNDSETPRNSSQPKRHKKRRNLSARCLSTDPNYDSSYSRDEQYSFQDFRASKEGPKRSIDWVLMTKSQGILSSIENRCSPKKSNDNITIELTPEFDNQTKYKNDFSAIPRVPLKTNNNKNCGVPLQKCYSENHASIMKAVQVSSDDFTLIGDFSKPYILPLLDNSKHQDLKSISCHVLADLLRGQYSNVIDTYTIIDCRFPYEFEGGHINNAINLYTQEHVFKHFALNRTKEAETSSIVSKRKVLIFHCEFSSERGPGLCRFLRNKDRVKNTGVYPNLYYPELYVLEGGYKEFYTHYSELCQPRAYLPMNAKNHEEELRKYRSLVKSHSFNTKFTTHKRNLRL